MDIGLKKQELAELEARILTQFKKYRKTATPQERMQHQELKAVLAALDPPQNKTETEPKQEIDMKKDIAAKDIQRDEPWDLAMKRRMGLLK